MAGLHESHETDGERVRGRSQDGHSLVLREHPIDQVVDNIEERTPKNAVTARLSDLLVGFDKHPLRSGLPQRSSASSVIANMYLAPIDEVLSDHAETIPGLRMSKLKYLSFARWMDDIWLFGQEGASARQAQVELQEEAHGIGLHLNAAKTEVLEGDAVAAAALQIEHSAVDDAILNEADFGPLEELIDRLLDTPEKAGRTSIKFITQRLLDNDRDYRWDDIIDLAYRMPHVADQWSRWFRQVFKRSWLQDWFLDYARSPWATHGWFVVEYGRMFVASEKPRRDVRDSSWIGSTTLTHRCR